MKISKRQLRQIIREEYARLNKRRMLKENQGHPDLASEVYAAALEKGMSPEEAAEAAKEAYNSGVDPLT